MKLGISKILKFLRADFGKTQVANMRKEKENIPLYEKILNKQADLLLASKCQSQK